MSLCCGIRASLLTVSQ